MRGYVTCNIVKVLEKHINDGFFLNNAHTVTDYIIENYYNLI